MKVHHFLLLDESVDPPVTHICETLNRVPRTGVPTKTFCDIWPSYKRIEVIRNLCPKCKSVQNNIFNRPIAPNGEGALNEEDSIARE